MNGSPGKVLTRISAQTCACVCYELYQDQHSLSLRELTGKIKTIKAFPNFPQSIQPKNNNRHHTWLLNEVINSLR